jgi:hypothetical protein
MKEEKPDDFDWVTERHKCSVLAKFKELELRVGEAVSSRKGLRIERADKEGFEFVTHGSAFVVARGVNRGVEFRLDGERIVIEKTGSARPANVVAVLTLNKNGDCRFRVGDEELQAWQLIRLALEDLFFD